MSFNKTVLIFTIEKFLLFVAYNVLSTPQKMTNLSQDISYIHHELACIQKQIIQKSIQGKMIEIKISRHEFVDADLKYDRIYGGMGMNEEERQYRVAEEEKIATK